MKFYEKPYFDFLEMNIEDAILTSVTIANDVYPDDESVVKVFD